jgi:hypothetical protein
LKRYGSCKLLVLMVGYALQRHLNTVRGPDMKRNEHEADSDIRNQKGISKLWA